MYRFGKHTKQLLLLAGDLLIFQLTLALTLVLRYGAVSRQVWDVHFLPFLIIHLAWVTAFYIAGLYDLTMARNSLKFLRSFMETMLVNLGLALGFFYLLPFFDIAPRTNLILHFALALLLVYAWRLLFNRTISQTIFKNRVLFIGRGVDAPGLHEILRQSAVGFELVAVAETSPGTRFDTGAITWHADLNEIDRILKERNVHTIVLGHRPDDIPGLRDALYKTLFTPVSLLDRAVLEEVTTGKVPLEHVSQTWFLEHLRESDKTWYESFKRVMDLVISVPVGAVTLVLSPVIALLVKFSSPGPIFYSQTRIGKTGKPFQIYKFRSMRQDAEIGGKPQWAVQGDPRITPVGRFLRATRLDELPQIWNVLRGDMSFIGPRPERPEFVDTLTAQMPYYALRHLTRPGLTGWAQVRLPYASSTEDNLKKLQYDLYYIKHRSPLLDLAIALKTIGVILRRAGT